MLRSDCCRVEGGCYLLGSIAGYVSIGTTIYATTLTPKSVGHLLTTGFLMLSYALKLGYYRDKRLALVINASMSVLWGTALVYAIVRFAA